MNDLVYVTFSKCMSMCVYVCARVCVRDKFDCARL